MERLPIVLPELSSTELAIMFGGTFHDFEAWLGTRPDLARAGTAKQLNAYSDFKHKWPHRPADRILASVRQARRELRKPPTWQQRIDNYVAATRYPRSLFIAEDGRVVGTWIMGNSYRVSTGMYGGYPDSYLKRMKALFPDKLNVLHLFSGKVDQSIMPGDSVDINPEYSPTYVDDAQRLERVPLERYDLIMADPPYSQEDAEHYSTTMIKRNVVMKALQRVRAGTHVAWLDQVLPMYRKDAWRIVACIGMVKSTNHRFRVITVFERI